MRRCVPGSRCRRDWRSENSSRSRSTMRRAGTCSVRKRRKCNLDLAPPQPPPRKWGEGAKKKPKQGSPACIEFFCDCPSPWTYPAFHNIQPLARELGVDISWRPILVGGIFNTVNPSVYAQRETPVPLKARYMKKDLADWARSAGLPIKMPPTVFPVNSVKAMRGCIWLGQDMVPFARAVFETYWGGDKDISQDSVLTEVCKHAVVDRVKLFEGIGQQAIKDQLKANTDEVMARGGFGSPTIFVDKTDMYFGNDRMPLIREAVLRLQEKAA